MAAMEQGSPGFSIGQQVGYVAPHWGLHGHTEHCMTDFTHPRPGAGQSRRGRQGAASRHRLGYSGGKAKALADVALHFAVDDMQISEDLQLIVGHMLMQWLYQHRPAGTA